MLNAVLIAVRRRRRPRGTLIHSDQGTQYGSDAWRRFCRLNHLDALWSGSGIESLAMIESVASDASIA